MAAASLLVSVAEIASASVATIVLANTAYTSVPKDRPEILLASVAGAARNCAIVSECRRILLASIAATVLARVAKFC